MRCSVSSHPRYKTGATPKRFVGVSHLHSVLTTEHFAICHNNQFLSRKSSPLSHTQFDLYHPRQYIPHAGAIGTSSLSHVKGCRNVKPRILRRTTARTSSRICTTTTTAGENIWTSGISSSMLIIYRLTIKVIHSNNTLNRAMVPHKVKCVAFADFYSSSELADRD